MGATTAFAFRRWTRSAVIIGRVRQRAIWAVFVDPVQGAVCGRNPLLCGDQAHSTPPTCSHSWLDLRRLVALFGTSAPFCRAARRVHSCKASVLPRPSAQLRAKRQWNTHVACRARGRSPVPFKLRRCPSALSASTGTVSPSFFQLSAGCPRPAAMLIL